MGLTYGTKIKHKATLLSLMILIFSNLNMFGESPRENISSWYGNENFQFNSKSEFLSVNMDKHPFESFTLELNSSEFQNSNICRLNLRTNEDCYIKIDISDGNTIGHSDTKNFIKVDAGKEFKSVSLDYTSFLKDKESSENLFLIVYVQPGSSFKGQIDFQYISFSKADETIKRDALSLYPSVATEFTMLQIPDGEYNLLRLIDVNGKVVRSIQNSFGELENYRLTTSNLAKGIYTVMLVGKEKSLKSNLIVQ